MVDAESRCYPIAWGIIDVETNESWGWFLGQLKLFVPDEPYLTFISDRHNAIKHGVETMYPNAQHVFCWWHIKQNLLVRYGLGKWVKIFLKAAKAATPEECRSLLDTLEVEYPEKRGKREKITIAKYLRDVCPPEKWSRAFAVNTRFDIICSNHAESMNAMLREARCHCVLSYFTYVVVQMSLWWYQRRNLSETYNTKLTPSREKIMHENYDIGKMLRVTAEADDQYRVTGRDHGTAKVYFSPGNWRCDCGKFQRDWQPCAHACACAAKLREKFPFLGQDDGIPDSDGLVMYKFTSEFYNTESCRKAYAGIIDVVPDRCDWDRATIPPAIRSQVTLAPVKQVRLGAPQTTRIPSEGERRRWATGKKYRCSFCHEEGHNVKKCPHKNNEMY